MKKYTYLFLTLFCIGLLTSCSKDDKDTTDEVWRLKNEEVFNALKFKPEYSTIQSEANNGVIYYKELKKGDGKKIYYNSQVKVYYKGSDCDGVVFDQKLFEDGIPFNAAVSSSVVSYNSSSNPSGYAGVILGWTVALQNMVVGDKWEVWIPQELGYGASANGSIKGYSTLTFEIEVVDVIQ